MTDKAKEPIKVVDRRHFTSEGDIKPAPSEERRPGEPQPAPPPEHPASAAAGSPGLSDSLSPFGEFVLSLASSCLFSLGQIPDTATGRPEPDLDAAGSILDVLEMLKEKTAGNLDAQESAILDQTLYQLKMTFVQARKGETS